MSYEPTQWSAGDTVTSAKLNKIEQGIVSNSNEPLIVTLQKEGVVQTFNKTWKEVHDAFMAGRPIIVEFDSGYETFYSHVICVRTLDDNSSYVCTFISYNQIESYDCNQENGYPSYSYD